MNQFIEFFRSKIINKRQKRNLVILLFIIISSMMMETLGLGVLVPIINTALDSNSSNTIINSLKNYNIFLESQEVGKFILIGALILYFLKFILLNISTYLKSRFSYNFNSIVSRSLHQMFLSRSYSSHIKYNAAELINIVQIEVPNLIAYINSIIIIITELSLFTGVISLLLFINFNTTLIILSILVFFFLSYNKLTRSIFKNWGKTRNYLDSSLSKILMESLHSFKHLKISKKEVFFQELYSNKQIQRANIYTKYATLLEFPRSLIEFLISIFIVFYFIIYSKQSGDNNIEQLSLLALYIASAFKILPGLLRLNNSIQNIKFYSNSFSIINDVFRNEEYEKQDFENINFNKKIELKNFDFKYGEKQVFKNSNFIIKKGDIIGIIGKSGSGKSTFIDLISGIIPFDSVKLDFDNKNLKINKKSLKVFSKIGYVTQSIYLLDDSIKKNIAFGINENEIDESKIKEIIKTLDLEDFVNSLKEGINTNIGSDGVNLSGGQKQRIGIARALYSSPDFLILDESTSALDINTEDIIIDSILKLKGKTTILMSTHRKSTLRICDSVYEIKNLKFKKINERIK